MVILSILEFNTKIMALSSHIKENIIKNIVILGIGVSLYFPMGGALAQIRVEQINDFLLLISMLLVTVCFANFAFTYEKSNLRTNVGRILAHFATGVFMLLIALLLESITLAVQVVYPSLHTMILGFSVLIYVGVILYDFWDLLRAES